MEGEIMHETIEGQQLPKEPSVPAENLTPPASEEDMDKAAAASSDLSDVEADDENDDDIGEVEPDHYWEDGKVPVFKPTMKQFKSFKKFIDKIDKYGMRSGIVKVIPPQEWRDSLPQLNEAVKTIKVKNPITQEFSGTHGTYTQANIEKQRSYNLPQWKSLTEEPQHQPPAKRGERRRNQAKIVRGSSTKKAPATRPPPPELPEGTKRRPGRPRKKPLPEDTIKTEDDNGEEEAQEPPTPMSPPKEERTAKTKVKKEPKDSPSKSVGRQPKSVSSRRMNNREEKLEEVDEAAFEGFEYKLEDVDEYTAERCAELEDKYWKTLTYAPPMYGADMPGSLFDDSTASWNVAKLENLLDVLGTKVPGVNTAYLYLGMWKATFAWHLEDVDLYSINYIHFGAPKQWYSISQEDARRFEVAMKNMWPNDAKNCDQFLRHKTYLISPSLLQQQYNIKVNKLVHYEGEFVITFPYGYHSGYNIGYNCAESVNFATEAWLDYGRIARKCHCEADSVWVDVGEIERKLRGEPTPEYYEETDDDEDDELEDESGNLPSPPQSVAGKAKAAPRKRKRDSKDKDGGKKVKRIKLRIKTPTELPCVLCPNVASFDKILPTDNGQRAHELCGLLTPETWVAEINGRRTVCNVAGIDKARLELRCIFCRSKRGACFQCGTKKCTRAYHATCAHAAGVDLDFGDVPTFGEDGTEYYMEGYHARCRYHRPKKPKNFDFELLEKDKLVLDYAKNLQPGQVAQAQVGQGEVFGGVVMENRPAEQSIILEVMPEGDRVEIEWKWLAPHDPAKSERPKPSEKAIPLPAEISQTAVSTQNQKDGPPVIGEPFLDNPAFKWQEFNPVPLSECRNPMQAKIQLDKPDQLWFYLGKTSTEARAQFTHDIKVTTHNTKSNFLDTVKPPAAPVQRAERKAPATVYPNGANVNALNGAMAASRHAKIQPLMRPADRPYEYKPKVPANYNIDSEALRKQMSFLGQGAGMPQLPGTPSIRPGVSGPTMYMGHAAYGSSAKAPAAPMQQRVPHAHSPPSISQRRPSQTSSDPQIDPRLLQGPTTPQSNPFPPYPPYSAGPSTMPARPVQQRAPVAPMMGSGNASSPTGTNTLFTPPPSRHSGQSLATPKQSPPTDTNYLWHLQKYPYLRNSYLRKPKHYASPYPPPGGFSPEYQPHPERSPFAIPRPRSSSVSGRPASSHSHQSYELAHAKYAQPMKPEPQYQSLADFQNQLGREARNPAPDKASLHRYEQLVKKIGEAVQAEGSTAKEGDAVAETADDMKAETTNKGKTDCSPQRPIPSPLSDYGHGAQINGMAAAAAVAGDHAIDPALMGTGGVALAEKITMPAMETWKYG
ncbi:MAG: hypothetical protein M1821_003227 [Bathelium mastoideum]|nr:MAG: hypothetical protein M1821_003227 [Bathelium mastoideum]KAI9689419.1 MAG: hypothetical protein M1822_010070 [Bathelium mastoideum]